MLVCIQALLLLAEHVFLLPSSYNAGWYFGVMLINLAFVLYLAFSAVLSENKYELFVFLSSIVLSTVKSVASVIWRQVTERRGRGMVERMTARNREPHHFRKKISNVWFSAFSALLRVDPKERERENETEFKKEAVSRRVGG